MDVSLYSFLMAVVCSSIFIVVLVRFRNKVDFMYSFGTASMMILFLGFTVRLVFPFEFPFAIEIQFFDGLYSFLYSVLETNLFFGISVLDVLIIIWVSVSLPLLVRLLRIYFSYIRNALMYENMATPEMYDCLKKVKLELGIKRVNLICIEDDIGPMSIGFKNIIILPYREYSNVDLYYILKHECTHLKNKDSYVKAMVEIFIAIFWWNPVVYMLRNNLGDILEIKCDLAIVGREDDNVKHAYLTAIKNAVAASSGESKHKKLSRLITTEFSAQSEAETKENIIIDRFKIVINYKHDKKKRRAYYTKFVIVVLFVLAVSYTFILQPAYSVPEDEIVEDGKGYEITPDNTYILETNDGKFILVSDNGVENEIDIDFKEMLILNGFELVKES